MTPKYTPGFMFTSSDVSNLDNVSNSESAEANELAAVPTHVVFEQDSTQDDIIDVRWQPVEKNIEDATHDLASTPQLSGVQITDPITLEVEPISNELGWLEPAAEATLIPAWSNQNLTPRRTKPKLESVSTSARAGTPTTKKLVNTRRSKKRRRGSQKPKSSSTALERHVNNYIVTDEDMETAKEWLERANTKPQTKQQLTTSTQTQVEPLTALWAWLRGPTKTKTATQRKTDGSAWLDMTGELCAAGADYSGRWYFICERDPNETDEMYFLRHWFMQVEFAEGATEWSEQGFMEWVASLSESERQTFAEAGGQIAGGHWQQHVNGGTSELINTMRESQQRSSVDTTFDSVVNAFLRLF